ncbi:hypothetical protein A2Z33_02985 [Candidatus Gottesmanbacteria bacterium RBG_16_52_11]|uniref:Uncharacterized protein n=1 Tax=Candidatus Gottesmanbacteria bacterium RBG_16_52_11 TaxID=1798374 RepID=A0A1F5YVH8_9BACT|nr:MAG: hypothetical protein A2Z33_02985 [Candidatus Gottesmanbacteria bacterium RBG_16_52_11]
MRLPSHLVKTIWESGRETSSGKLKIRTITGENDKPGQFAVLVGSKGLRAVDRNRWKRLVREALIGMRHRFKYGTRSVIRTAGPVPQSRTQAEILIHRLLSQAGLIR